MKLIMISSDILINPEKISKIAIAKDGKNKKVRITVDGETHLLEVSLDNFLKELVTVGIDPHAQFFAG